VKTYNVPLRIFFISQQHQKNRENFSSSSVAAAAAASNCLSRRHDLSKLPS